MGYIEALVSIIMPAHNAAGTIADAIKSVISQSYTDWELIIIDDCSSDTTADIAESYLKRDKRIQLLHTDKTVGKPYYPRNMGIKIARGRYIAFLDSDDVWLPDKLEKQIPLFKDNQTAIVFSDYEKFFLETETSKEHIITAPPYITYKTALYGNQIGNLTAEYDVAKVGKVFFIDVGHEDYVLWLTILKKGYKAVNTGTIEAKYRVSNKSVSANKKQAALWTWNIYRKILHFNFLHACFCYCVYALRGILKYFK